MLIGNIATEPLAKDNYARIRVAVNNHFVHNGERKQQQNSLMLWALGIWLKECLVCAKLELRFILRVSFNPENILIAITSTELAGQS